jgi:alkanesulfonate monooxygenase SsuD/methylene tetrahydromethanopterin reductase-like flavin-dependent oxidoreductase (luciferase family)
MTHDAPPPMPDFPPPPPAPKRPRNWVVIGSAAAVIAAVIGTGVFVVNSRDDDTGAASTSASSTPTEDTVTAAAEEPEPTYAVVDADSFTIELRTTRRQCFGSAGCNVTVEPDLTLLVDSEAIDPDAVYEITYEIRGDEDGPVIETAELSDQTSVSFSQSLVTVPSSSTKVSVKITDVAERGY